jgi:hypothetical protein
MPAPLVTLEATLEKAKVLDTVRYWYLVESENGRQWKHWYKGENAADAMAAYTAAILDGNEYVMLESLRMPNGPNQG